MEKTKKEYEFGSLIESVNEVLDEMINRPIPEEFRLMLLPPVNGGRLSEKELHAMHRALSDY